MSTKKQTIILPEFMKRDLMTMISEYLHTHIDHSSDVTIYHESYTSTFFNKMADKKYIHMYLDLGRPVASFTQLGYERWKWFMERAIIK